jgi:hypothetical protein
VNHATTFVPTLLWVQTLEGGIVSQAAVIVAKRQSFNTENSAAQLQLAAATRSIPSPSRTHTKSPSRTI